MNSGEVIQNRHSPHSLGSRVTRAIWNFAYVLLFRPSPRILHRWRNWLLRAFGAKLHPTARVYPRARIFLPSHLIMGKYSCVADDVEVNCPRPLTIGDYSTVSQHSYLSGATHDYKDVKHPLIPLPITIGRRCWVAADVFVAPGVTIGDGTVVGARSSVFKDLPPWVVASGTPAVAIRKRELGSEDFGEVEDNDGSRPEEEGIR